MRWTGLPILNKSIYSSLLFFTILGLSAQVKVEEYEKKYSQYNEVYIDVEKVYHMKVVKDKLEIESEETSEKLILEDANKVSFEDNFMSNSFYEIIDKEAKTISPTGKSIKINDFRVVKDFDLSYAFHDDTQITKFNYPALEKGSIKYKRFVYKYSDPHILDNFAFVENAPADKIKLVVITDKNIELGYKIFNEPKDLIFTKKEEGKDIIYTWEMKSSIPPIYESNTLGYLYYIPHIEIYVKSYKDSKGKEIKILSSVDDLHNLYNNFLLKIKEGDLNLLTEITQKIIKPEDTEEEKVKKIYNWVQNNIKYIAIEDGYEGFVPRSASVTLQNKYGDCKDMANIIYNMAKIAKIDNVHLTWIGTRERPYSYSELHTPAVDNHMISIYKKGNEYIPLDATSEYTQFGYPSSFIQGKQAMVHLGGNQYELVKIKEMSPEENQKIENINAKIEDNITLVGDAEVQLTGYLRELFLAYLTEKKGEDQVQITKELLQKGNNKFVIKSTSERTSKTESVYTLDYNFEIGNYVTTFAGESFVNLFLEKPLENNIIKNDRKFDFKIDNRAQYIYTVNLDITNYEVTYIPEEFNIDNELISFHAKYQKNGNILTLQYELKEKTLLVKKTQFDLYNKTIVQLKKYYSQSIGLKKK